MDLNSSNWILSLDSINLASEPSEEKHIEKEMQYFYLSTNSRHWEYKSDEGLICTFIFSLLVEQLLVEIPGLFQILHLDHALLLKLLQGENAIHKI